MKIVSVFLTVLLLLMISPTSARAQTPSAAEEERIRQYFFDLKVRVVSASWCPYCKRLKQTLHKSLSAGVLPVVYNGVHLDLPLKLVEDDKSVPNKTDGFPEAQLLEGSQIRAAFTPGPYDDDEASQAVSEWMAKAFPLEKVLKAEKSIAFVTFMTTGFDASEIPFQPANTLYMVKTELVKEFHVPRRNTATLFGEGTPDGGDADGYQINSQGEPEWITWPGLKADGYFVKENIKWASQKAESLRLNNRLWILTGHGAPNLINTWNSDPINSQDLKEAMRANSPASNILIDGNCYGGSFASAVSCGFFEARPDTVAYACAPVKTDNTDYVTAFFQAIKNNSDANHDGKVSFAEAHWQATLESPRDVPFTSIDALADRMFRSWERQRDPRFLDAISSGDFEKLVNVSADPGEAKAAAPLIAYARSAGRPAFSLSLSVTRSQETEWQEIRLVQMARRLLLKRAVAQDPSDGFAAEYARLQKCESQGVLDYLRLPAR